MMLTHLRPPTLLLAALAALFTLPAHAVTCGDSVQEFPEQCDDGNDLSGDGCSSGCLVEPGFFCTDAVPGAPSDCYAVCDSWNFDDPDAEPLADWQLLSAAPTQMVWGSTNDGVCWSGTLGPPPATNVTGGTGQAACIDADQFGPGLIDAWMCTAVNAALIQSPKVSFLYDYHVFEAADENDAFEVRFGTELPLLANLAAYQTLFHSNQSTGELAVAPGAEIVVDMPAQDGYLCFRYLANFDWYAQLDDVRVSGAQCRADADDDQIADALDNCIETPNPSQEDTDADGIGNPCDADLNNDCQVDFADLFVMKSEFFSDGAASDLNADGVTNFQDLAIFKLRVFRPPGPSGLPNACEP